MIQRYVLPRTRKPAFLHTEEQLEDVGWQAFGIVQDLPDENNDKRNTPCVNRVHDEAQAEAVAAMVMRAPRFQIAANNSAKLILRHRKLGQKNNAMKRKTWHAKTLVWFNDIRV